MLHLLLLSFLFAFFITVNSKQCPTRSFIENSLLDAHIPGAVMVVVNTTDILYQEAFGHESFSPTKLLDVNNSIFVLASISKTFLATAVMQLVESNLLELDTNINQYLLSSDPIISHPLYPTQSITLRQLLSHSASIGLNEIMETKFYQPGDKGLTETTLAEACFTYLSYASNWLPYPPGTVTLYSNTGIALAGLVVERVAKMSYEQYIKDKVLKPLGIDIKKAGFRLSDIEDQTNLVKHYAFNSSQLQGWNAFLPQLNITEIDIPNWLYIPFYSVTIYPAGLLRMSAYSLSLHLRMFMNNGSSILHPESIVQMKTPVVGVIPYENINMTNNGSSLPPLEFGVVWYWQTLENGRRYLGHGGTMLGARNSMLINEKGDLGVIILTNADITSPDDISKKIITTIINIQLALFDCFEN